MATVVSDETGHGIKLLLQDVTALCMPIICQVALDNFLIVVIKYSANNLKIAVKL